MLPPPSSSLLALVGLIVVITLLIIVYSRCQPAAADCQSCRGGADAGHEPAIAAANQLRAAFTDLQMGLAMLGGSEVQGRTPPVQTVGEAYAMYKGLSPHGGSLARAIQSLEASGSPALLETARKQRLILGMIHTLGAALGVE